MQKVKDASTHQKETAAAEQRTEEMNHVERIKAQVLAKIGRPPRLKRVEVTRHHGGNYRVNIWQQPEPDGNLALMLNPRIGLSYYLKVSNTGEIIHSDPPLTKVGSSA